MFDRPKLIDKEKDIWSVKCPRCKVEFEDRRHGYSSRFPSEMYFHCPNCEFEFEAPRRD